jgi:hypothetical protein
MLAAVPGLAAIPAAPVFGLMAMGIVIALAGHITRNRRAVGVGIALLFIATALMIIGGFAAYQSDEPDLRPSKPPSEPGF